VTNQTMVGLQVYQPSPLSGVHISSFNTHLSHSRPCFNTHAVSWQYSSLLSVFNSGRSGVNTPQKFQPVRPNFKTLTSRRSKQSASY